MDEVHEGFEKFVRWSCPHWLVKLDRTAEGLYQHGKTNVLYLAWLLGVNGTSIAEFVTQLELEGYRVDYRDRRCFSLNRHQRLYWCYTNGRRFADPSYEVPLLDLTGLTMNKAETKDE